MPDNDEDPNDWKLLFALGGIFVYILLSWLVFGFSWEGFVFFLSFTSLVLNHNFQKGNVFEAKILILFVLWAAVWLVGVFGFPEYAGTRYFLMLAIGFSAGMEMENIVIFLGTTLLTVILFGSSIISMIIIITLSLFMYSSLESVGTGLIMLIPLLAVGWFIGSGWGNYVEQKVGSIGTQVSAQTGIDADSVTRGVTSALNDTWLLFTNPNQWYTNKFVERGTRAEDASAFALEIVNVGVIPREVMAEEEFDLQYELYNKGKESAENVRIIAKGDKLAEACGKINGRLCGTSCGTGTVSCALAVPLGELRPKERRKESISFSAPKCPGTYAVGAKVMYGYTAYGVLSLEMISRDYYEELSKNDKLEFKDVLSTSSAGPFKITLQTNRQQPIPDKPNIGEGFQNFTIYVGLVNEHEGTAKLNKLSLFVPENLEAHAGDASCQLTYDGMITKEKCAAALGDSLCTKYYDFKNDPVPLSKNISAIPFDNFKKLGLVASTMPGYIQYAPKTSGAEVAENAMKSFKCEFNSKDAIELRKTYDLKTYVNYTFTYIKQTSINVRGTSDGMGVAKPDCKKEVTLVDATAPGQSTPQTAALVSNSLARKIAVCYTTNKDWVELGSTTCPDVGLNLACNEKISVSGLKSEIRMLPDIDNSLKEDIANSLEVSLDKLLKSDAGEFGSNKYSGTMSFGGFLNYKIRVDLTSGASTCAPT